MEKDWNRAEACEAFKAICDEIDADNRRLLKEMRNDSFAPAEALDCTLNGAQYRLLRFFTLAKRFGHGEIQKHEADKMVASSKELVDAIKERYGNFGNVRELAQKVGQAFRRSHLLWRTDQQTVQMDNAVFARHLDEALNVIFGALDALNLELSKMADEAHQKRASRKPRVLSPAKCAKILKGRCEKENIADCAIGTRTFWRWEHGDTVPRAGYTANCRESLAAFMAWVERYVAEEKARLNTNKAVSYCDEWAKHGRRK